MKALSATDNGHANGRGTQILESYVNISMAELVGGIAHQLNNILTVVMRYGSLLRARINPDDPLEACVGHILSASERAADVTKKLLAFGGLQRMRPTVTDLNEVVRSAPRLLSPFSTHGIELQMGFATQELPVMIDVVRFEEALVNLISNAVHAMPEGGTLAITAELLKFEFSFGATNGDNGWAACAVLRIFDTGTGMTSEVKEKMFHPFFTTKDTGNGVGLGLPIVHRIVKEHRGNIKVRSVMGQGTEVDIYLPLIGQG